MTCSELSVVSPRTPATRALCAAAALLLATGCASTSEVKLASMQVGVALEDLRDAQAELRRVMLREIDATQDVMEEAIVSAAVAEDVRALADELETEGNLLTISETLRSTQEVYQSLANQMRRAPLSDQKPADVVAGVFRDRVAQLRASADALEAASTRPEVVLEIRSRAREMEEWAQSVEDDQLDGIGGDFVALVRLEALKGDVRAGTKDLDDVLQFLQLVHATVHEWIITDVKPDGKAVAKLIDEHAATLGLADSNSGEEQ